MQLTQPTALPAGLTLAEFEQLARDVFSLVQRERAYAEIDVSALAGKSFTREEETQLKNLLGLYFAEMITRTVDAQTAPKALTTETMHDWVRNHLRPAA